MLFWKKIQQKINGKWYPRLVTIGKPATTQEIAERLARESTVSPADVHAVLRALPHVMAEIMAESRSVSLDGLGSFRYSVQCGGKGVDTPEAVSSDQIVGLRVQFTPAREKKGTGFERSLVGNVSFTEWLGKEKPKKEENPKGEGGEEV